MMTANLSFQYLYRDASNYKLHGEAVFTNETSLSLEEIEKQIRACLRDGEFFIARQVHIEERFFDALDEQDDHPWHEFAQVALTNETLWDPDGIPERDITAFLAELEKAHITGWDETNVRDDMKRLLEKQKASLKQTLGGGDGSLQS